MKGHIIQLSTTNIISDAREMQQRAAERHQEVLNMIEAQSNASISDGASLVGKDHYF
jgi:predicted transcriptional regulator